MRDEPLDDTGPTGTTTGDRGGGRGGGRGRGRGFLESADQGDRLVVGMALAVPIGAALSLGLDDWTMMGVGIALGAVFGLLSPEDDDPA